SLTEYAVSILYRTLTIRQKTKHSGTPLACCVGTTIEAHAPLGCKCCTTRQIGRRIMYTASKAALATLVLALLAAGSVRAQGVNGSISATATVQSPLTRTCAQNLAFGNAFPGDAETVAYSAATTAARCDVTVRVDQP